VENFRLKVFRTVAGRLNFTQAADALHLTQPAVTLKIKALEESLAVKLCDRTGSRVSLTFGAELLLQYGGQITGEERRRLALGASTTIAHYILPLLMAGSSIHTRGSIPSCSAGTQKRLLTHCWTSAWVWRSLRVHTLRSDLKTEHFIEDEIVTIVSPGDEWNLSSSSVIAERVQEVLLILRERGSARETLSTSR
jgi:hypothetical protein